MIRQKLATNLKESIKAKDQRRTSTLRLILAAIKDRDIAERGKGEDQGINDQAILSLLQSMIKQRRDSIEMYEKGGRMELAEGEAKEIEIIEEFLPKQMDESEIEKVVGDLIAELEATSLKDMGRIMAGLRENYAGQMDFGKASARVKAILAGS